MSAGPRMAWRAVGEPIRRGIRSLRVCLAAALALGGADAAPARSLVAESLRIPMAVAGPEGLEAVVVRPDGPGGHPLVAISHGSPRDPAVRPGLKARGMLAQATAFAHRGFVAVSVLRRGYGTSPGG